VELDRAIRLTWLGHATFRLDIEDKVFVIDPWVMNNPKTPADKKSFEKIDVMLCTHGHGDHIGDAADLGKKFSPKLVAIIELAGWLEGQGFPNASQLGFNKGGTIDVDGIQFTMTHAVHSSSFTVDGTPVYLGDPAGYVVEFENGTKIYFAGDTAAFSDMQIIGKYLEPDVAVLPIGDHFTMGPRQAAVALELLGTKRCIPCHYGTFPVLTGTPDDLRKVAPGVEIIELQPGETTTV